MKNQNLIVKNGNYIDVEKTLENVYELFVERTARGLLYDDAKECKEHAEMCRYEASKHLTMIFGLGWKAAGNILSLMSKGDKGSAVMTVKRCML